MQYAFLFYNAAEATIFPSIVSPCEAIAATKIIVSLPQLLQLVPKVCRVKNCLGSVSIQHQFVGATVVLTMACSSGHRYTWYSSPQHVNKVGSRIFYNNVLLAAAVLLSGNAHDKIVRMMKFLGLKCVMRLSIVRPTTPCTGLIGEVGGFDISINPIFPPHGAPPAIKSPVANRGHIGGGGEGAGGIDCHAFSAEYEVLKGTHILKNVL